ncbi:MAG: ATP-binding cassette domain-containing protein [Acutalibacteraceae bacterium]
MKPIIEIAHLSKRFGDLEAVRDLSFTVREGELFAFLGVNGAGKSTTISILCGRLRQDAGEVRIGGRQRAGGRGNQSPARRRIPEFRA